MRVFVDTNVLVYLFDDAEPEKQRAARDRLRALATTAELVISTQVLQELYVALTRGSHPMRTGEVAEQIVRDQARATVVQIDAPLVLSAIGSSRRWRVSLWDALILEAAASHGCDVVLSEDLSDGQRYGRVRVENPFD